MFRRAATAALAVAFLATTGLTACAPITSYSGFQAIDSDPKDVQVGTDTKSTVRAKLGSPSVTSTFDPNVWFYVNQVKQRVAFQKPRVTARNVTAIAFNKDSELVDAVNTYTLKDGKWVVLRVPYPLGYYTKWMDGRIDDPNAGWKGRGLWSTRSCGCMAWRA